MCGDQRKESTIEKAVKWIIEHDPGAASPVCQSSRVQNLTGFNPAEHERVMHAVLLLSSWIRRQGYASPAEYLRGRKGYSWEYSLEKMIQAEQKFQAEERQGERTPCGRDYRGALEDLVQQYAGGEIGVEGFTGELISIKERFIKLPDWLIEGIQEEPEVEKEKPEAEQAGPEAIPVPQEGWLRAVVEQKR